MGEDYKIFCDYEGSVEEAPYYIKSRIYDYLAYNGAEPDVEMVESMLDIKNYSRRTLDYAICNIEEVHETDLLRWNIIEKKTGKELTYQEAMIVSSMLDDRGIEVLELE